MLNIVLFEPEIPHNTGNIIRLCANTGAKLHLIKPYGFYIKDKRLRRAGLDYKDLINIVEYDSLDDFLHKNKTNRILIVNSKCNKLYNEVNYQKNDFLLFGKESIGLPDDVCEKFLGVSLPMQKTSRSINLSNCVAIVAYEAWRQLNFCKL